MEIPSKDLLGLFNTLVPGFLAAWVFYGLTAHPKKTPFERTIQALIFTLFVQVMTFGVHRLLVVAVSRGWPSYGVWDQSAALTWSAANAVLIGALFAVVANKDWFHAFARALGITKRTSYPSEWYRAFDEGSRKQRYLILHLSGDRRPYGWPEEWPDQPDSGHFVLQMPVWLLPDGHDAPLYRVDRILIPASEVQMVEFLKSEDEVMANEEELAKAQSLLVNLQAKGGKNHGI